MLEREKPDRELQIKLMVEAADRLSGYVHAWLQDGEVKASLHRYNDAPSPKLKRFG